MKRTFWVVLAAGCGIEPDLDLGLDLDAPTGRWLVRVAPELDGPCPEVTVDEGTWSGRPVEGPAGPSPDFCVYGWRSAGGWTGDPDRLGWVAMAEPVAFLVPDERPHEQAASLLAWTAAPPASPGFRDSVPTCEVCVSWDPDWMWVVLPPETFEWTLNGLYRFEDPGEQVFWGPVPEDLRGEELYLTF